MSGMTHFSYMAVSLGWQHTKWKRVFGRFLSSGSEVVRILTGWGGSPQGDSWGISALRSHISHHLNDVCFPLPDLSQVPTILNNTPDCTYMTDYSITQKKTRKGRNFPPFFLKGCCTQMQDARIHIKTLLCPNFTVYRREKSMLPKNKLVFFIFFLNND